MILLRCQLVPTARQQRLVLVLFMAALRGAGAAGCPTGEYPFHFSLSVPGCACGSDSCCLLALTMTHLSAIHISIFSIFTPLAAFHESKLAKAKT
jgi:hypothetical protein